MNYTFRERISLKLLQLARNICDHYYSHEISRVGTTCRLCGKLLTTRYPIGGK